MVELHQADPTTIAHNDASITELVPQNPPLQAADSAFAAPSITVKSLVDSSVHYLPWLWIVGTPITFALLTAGIVGTKRLRPRQPHRRRPTLHGAARAA
jgi:hypothetical protein